MSEKKLTKITKSIELAKRSLVLEVGTFAGLATASVLGRYADTMVLATVVEGQVRTDIDYFPLTVEYVERLYAGGKIKGSRWVKREGRPSDEAVLIARLIDRSIRPLFPKEYKNEVQVVVTVLSVDGENSPDVLSIITTSAALAISGIPWNGPIGTVRVGLVKEEHNGALEFLINPTTGEVDFSELDMVISQTKEKTIMIEAGAREQGEEKILEAIEHVTLDNQKIIELISELVTELDIKKREVKKDEELKHLASKLKKNYKGEIEETINTLSKKEGGGPAGFAALVDRIFEDEGDNLDKSKITTVLTEAVHENIRERILAQKERPDGRTPEAIREISASVSVLPRTHGSAVFQRGETQTLTVVTLGSPTLSQLIESAEGEETKRYMHHYSMPPYSVGETGRIGFPSRREIGHGALAERALLPVIPTTENFPYTIRVVSEIMSSNGSTSMAAVCGSTLSLMDAGVPIKEPVSGIAMGLVSGDKDYVILSDITGLEDFAGFMDFKIAGTKNGITAIQLDVKNTGLTVEIIKEILTRGREGRLFILDKMREAITEVRTSVSQFAPKIEVLHIDTAKIGDVIGPGGKTIRNIIAQTDSTVDVEDDGTVTITGAREDEVKKAVDWIKGITMQIVSGQVFEGEVKRILPFGAFVEILPGREGMVHVSRMASGFVKDPGEVVKIGDKVKVKVIEIDEIGRVNLSMILEGEKYTPKGPRPELRSPESGHRRDQGQHRGSRGPRGPRAPFDVLRQTQAPRFRRKPRF